MIYKLQERQDRELLDELTTLKSNSVGWLKVG